MASGGDGYIHGTTPAERRRLGRLNALLNDGSLARLSLRPGQRVLDVGCGLAQLTRAMGRAVGPGGTVIGVERNAVQRAEARRLARDAGEASLFELRAADATSAVDASLPLSADEWGTFDVVHARFVLEHVTDPAAVVRAMLRAAAPGGRVVLEDDDHDVLRLWPEPAGFREAWRAYAATYEARGRDPYVGRRLVALLREAGAEALRNDTPFFGGCAGHRDFEILRANLLGILEGAAADITRWSGFPSSGLRAALDRLRAWGSRDDAALWYHTCWAAGTRGSRAERVRS